MKIKRFIYSLLLMAFILFVFPRILDLLFGTSHRQTKDAQAPAVMERADTVAAAFSDTVN